jgi:hypothetical protein
MEIDRNHLPEDPTVLRKAVVGLLEKVDTQGQRLRQVQHFLEQLLGARYRPKRERIRRISCSGLRWPCSAPARRDLLTTAYTSHTHPPTPHGCFT